MLELHEREEQAAPDNRAAAEKAAQSQRLQEAGLAGVESMLEDLVAAEPEWAKLAGIPGLLDPWHDVREKTGVVADEFKVCVCVWGGEACVGGWGGSCWGQVWRSLRRRRRAGHPVPVRAVVRGWLPLAAYAEGALPCGTAGRQLPLASQCRCQ
jgi:hypothetical protein